MLLSAVSVLVVAQSSSEIPEGLMNNPVYYCIRVSKNHCILILSTFQFTMVLAGRSLNMSPHIGLRYL